MTNFNTLLDEFRDIVSTIDLDPRPQHLRWWRVRMRDDVCPELLKEYARRNGVYRGLSDSARVVAGVEEKNVESSEGSATGVGQAADDVWIHQPNSFHKGNDCCKYTDEEGFSDRVNGLTSGEIITQAKAHCETQGYPGFSYNRKSDHVYFHKLIDPSKVVININNRGGHRKYLWHDLYYTRWITDV
jgi:hypothetical protein